MSPLIQRFYLLFLMLQTSSMFTITVMLCPMGDGQYTGREIDGMFERSLTMLCAQEVKKELQQNSNINVILTRAPADTPQPFDNAAFANRLNVDLYVNIAFYQETTSIKHVTFFYYLENPLDLLHTFNPGQIYHAHQAHLISIKPTQKAAQAFIKVFGDSSKSQAFVYQGCFGLPCYPLLAIKTPALMIEAGLEHKDDYKMLVGNIVTSIQEALS